MRHSCATCAYRVEDECRRRPPADGWPKISKRDWCGEYRPYDMVKQGVVQTDVDILGDDVFVALRQIGEMLNTVDDTLKTLGQW